jgi:NAD(P)-dependent dehydrogenase (short-subunit alcohol dehydrogenase family)
MEGAVHALKSKVAIVTGAASGIGQAIAAEYARQGAKVAIVDILEATDTLKATVDAGAAGLGIVCDVSDAGSVVKMIATVQKEWGKVDVLVNNAALLPNPFQPVDELSIESWDRIFAVNIRGMFLCTRAVVPLMRAANRGKIINISSSTFFLGIPYASAYVASKGAVVGFSRALARELGISNIQVNVITPGLIPTTPGVMKSGLPAEAVLQVVAAQCLHRQQSTDDVLGAAVFLASGASDFVTGQIVNVDGGATMT